MGFSPLVFCLFIPMLTICILGSGSSGNATVVYSATTTVLVDAGLSARQLLLRLAVAGIPLDSINAILLTHEHSDHTHGLETFCKKHSVPVYCNALTRESLAGQLKKEPGWRMISSGRVFEIGGHCGGQFFSAP